MYARYGFISKIGVPSIRSAPRIWSIGPVDWEYSMDLIKTEDKPIGFGLNGDLVANTPIRFSPPRRGGLTVGDHSSRMASENSHISHIWVQSSNPLNASGFRYLGSMMIRDSRLFTNPLWRGMPNLVAKSQWMCPIGSKFIFVLSRHHWQKKGLVQLQSA